ncbi:hypothetical protein A2U01_0022345, partial [Trifolium medium]|nr:hypothetical protein [Trifolium medium]
RGLGIYVVDSGAIACNSETAYWSWWPLRRLRPAYEALSTVAFIAAANGSAIAAGCGPNPVSVLILCFLVLASVALLCSLFC